MASPPDFLLLFLLYAPCGPLPSGDAPGGRQLRAGCHCVQRHPARFLVS